MQQTIHRELVRGIYVVLDVDVAKVLQVPVDEVRRMVRGLAGTEVLSIPIDPGEAKVFAIQRQVRPEDPLNLPDTGVTAHGLVRLLVLDPSPTMVHAIGELASILTVDGPRRFSIH